MKELALKWLEAKKYEQMATDTRRALEDEMTALLKIPESLDGVSNNKIDGFVIKVTGRIDKKVNSELLQELAFENGLSDHLSSLFRWTPTINASVWNKATDDIKKPLMGAITAKPGRPTYKIEEI